MFPFIRVNTLLTYFLHYYIFYRHLELKLRKKTLGVDHSCQKQQGFNVSSLLVVYCHL